MKSKFHHEDIYRNQDVYKVLSNFDLTICGAGALGSNLADSLTRQGFSKIKVIDMDRVENHNLGTQIWSQSDIGALKTEALKNKIFRNVGVEIESLSKEMTTSNVAKFLKRSSLVIDAFDNAKSRQLLQDEVRKQKLACIHAGLFADYGEVVWDENYKVPKDGEGDVCDYPLARNVIMFTVTILSEEILSFCLNKNHKKRNLAITLKDLKINGY